MEYVPEFKWHKKLIPTRVVLTETIKALTHRGLARDPAQRAELMMWNKYRYDKNFIDIKCVYNGRHSVASFKITVYNLDDIHLYPTSIDGYNLEYTKQVDQGIYSI